jgi:hypothetical protein
MDSKKWLFVFAACSGIGGLASFLYWLGIKPKDLWGWQVSLAIPHWLLLVGALLLFVVSIGLSVYGLYYKTAPPVSDFAQGKPKWKKLQSANAEREKLEGEVRKWKDLAEQRTGKSQEITREIQELVNNDAENMRSRVRQQSQHIGFHFDPTSDPYVEIITELWNGSVFQLMSFGEITGHVTYAGKQLAGDPRVVVSVEPPLINLGHGDSVTLIVRHYLSSQVAETMEANRNRGATINFESVFVPFKIMPLDGLTKVDEYRWQGPRFAIEDAKRV